MPESTFASTRLYRFWGFILYLSPLSVVSRCFFFGFGTLNATIFLIPFPLRCLNKAPSLLFCTDVGCAIDCLDLASLHNIYIGIRGFIVFQRIFNLECENRMLNHEATYCANAKAAATVLIGLAYFVVTLSAELSQTTSIDEASFSTFLFPFLLN